MTSLSERLRALLRKNEAEIDDLRSKLDELSDLSDRLTKATGAFDATAVSAVLKDAARKGLRLDADDLGDSTNWASLSDIEAKLKEIERKQKDLEDKAQQKGIKIGDRRDRPSTGDENEALVDVDADFCEQLGRKSIDLRSMCKNVSDELQVILQLKEGSTAGIATRLQQTADRLVDRVEELWGALISRIVHQVDVLAKSELDAASSLDKDLGPSKERLRGLHGYSELLRKFSLNKAGLSLSEDAMKAIGRYQTVKNAWNARAEDVFSKASQLNAPAKDLVSQASPPSPMPWLQSHYLVCSVQIWNVLKSIDNDKGFDRQIEDVMKKLRSCETSIRAQALIDLKAQIKTQWQDALKTIAAKWTQTPEDPKVFEELLFLQPPFPGTQWNPELLKNAQAYQAGQLAKLVSAKLRQEQLLEKFDELIRSAQDLPDEFTPQDMQNAWKQLDEAERLIPDRELPEFGDLQDKVNPAQTNLKTQLDRRLESLLKSDEGDPGTDATPWAEWLRLAEEHQVLEETIVQLKERLQSLQEQSQQDVLQKLIEGLQNAIHEVQKKQDLSDPTRTMISDLWKKRPDNLREVSPDILEQIRKYSGQLTTKLDELDTPKSRKQVNELKQISNTIDSN